MGSTGRQALKWTAVLIGFYLAVEYATGLTKDIGSATSGGSNVIKTLQGR